MGANDATGALLQPPARSDASADENERKAPLSWSLLLGCVPSPFRAVILDGAWRLHDETMTSIMNNPDRIKGWESNTAQTTGMSHISYAKFLPYHLVEPDQMALALDLLRQDTHKFLLWTRQAHPTADRALIIGDAPTQDVLDAFLDKELRIHPANTLLCGPGRSIESMLRNYGASRNYVTSHIASVDADRVGASWDQVPGPLLDKLTSRIFTELQPDRLIAFDPVRMPATQATLAHARQKGIPVLYVDEPTYKRRAAP